MTRTELVTLAADLIDEAVKAGKHLHPPQLIERLQVLSPTLQVASIEAAFPTIEAELRRRIAVNERHRAALNAELQRRGACHD
jgi:hypothetical protein